jgi:hypothetical protein
MVVCALGRIDSEASANSLFCAVLGQVSKNQSASHIYPVDRNMESFDLDPCTACLGKVSDQADRDFVFHPFAIRLSRSTGEQYPGFALSTLFLFLATRVGVAAPLSSLIDKANALRIIEHSETRDTIGMRRIRDCGSREGNVRFV